MKNRDPIMIRLTRFLVGFKLTPLGRVAVLGIFLSAVGGVTVEIPVYQVFCGWVCLFGVIEATGMLLRPKLELKASFPDRVTEGESVTGLVTVKNIGWLPACDIMCALLGLPPGLKHVDGDRSIAAIPKGGSAMLPVTVQADRRGEYHLPPARIHSTFPFNLMRFGKAKTSGWELRVLPSFQPLEELEIPFSRKIQAGGSSVEVRVGDSPEYIGNRDYTPGEPVRRLDFKAWARVGRPVIREYQDEFSVQGAVFLDTFHTRRWGGNSKLKKRLEAAVSLTAAIAHQMDQHDASVEVLMTGADLYLFQPSTGTTHFESVLDILSEAELIQHDSLHQMTPLVSEALEEVAVVFCVFIDWDEQREGLVREIIESGCSVRVLIVHERDLSDLIPGDGGSFTLLSPQSILDGEVCEL